VASELTEGGLRSLVERIGHDDRDAFVASADAFVPSVIGPPSSPSTLGNEASNYVHFMLRRHVSLEYFHGGGYVNVAPEGFGDSTTQIGRVVSGYRLLQLVNYPEFLDRYIWGRTRYEWTWDHLDVATPWQCRLVARHGYRNR
jgi:hypothetical protein